LVERVESARVVDRLSLARVAQPGGHRRALGDRYRRLPESGHGVRRDFGFETILEAPRWKRHMGWLVGWLVGWLAIDLIKYEETAEPRQPSSLLRDRQFF
jgi:hypothetical protein